MKELRLVSVIGIAVLLFRALYFQTEFHIVLLVIGYAIPAIIYRNPFWILDDIRYILTKAEVKSE